MVKLSDRVAAVMNFKEAQKAKDDSIEMPRNRRERRALGQRTRQKGNTQKGK